MMVGWADIVGEAGGRRLEEGGKKGEVRRERESEPVTKGAEVGTVKSNCGNHRTLQAACCAMPAPLLKFFRRSHWANLGSRARQPRHPALRFGKIHAHYEPLVDRQGRPGGRRGKTPRSGRGGRRT